MDQLTIERIGGLGGFGLPGSRLRSRGTVATADLSAADRKAVEALFAGGDTARDDKAPHGFRYRITRQTDGGAWQTVEVGEAQAPAALTGAVRDEFE